MSRHITLPSGKQGAPFGVKRKQIAGGTCCPKCSRDAPGPTASARWRHQKDDRFVAAVAQALSHVRLCAIPWTAARQASLSITISRSFLKLSPSHQ